jgi:hypothetical protein
MLEIGFFRIDYDYTSIVKPCFSATDLINRENLP